MKRWSVRASLAIDRIELPANFVIVLAVCAVED